MPRNEAESLLQGLPREAWRSECWEPAADLQMLEALAATASARFSPQVALEPLTNASGAGPPLGQPQALLLELTHLDKLFGSEGEILRQIQTWLQGWEVRGAIADTVGAAWGIAHFATQKHAWRIVKPQHTELALAPLPVTALRLPTETATLLRRLGIETIGELLRLPRYSLATRFGKGLLQRIDQALGRHPEPLRPHRSAPEPRATHRLDYPTRDAAILKDRLAGLTETLCRQLAAHRQGVLRLRCDFEFSGAATATFQLGLFAPTSEASHLIRLLHARFDQQRLADEVERIVLAAPLQAPLRQYQATLLADDSAGRGLAAGPAARLETARLIDNLSGRLGNERVLGVTSGDDPLPENACQLYPLAGAQRSPASSRRPAARRHVSASPGSSSSHASHLPAATSPLRRPLTLLPEPLALQVESHEASSIPPRFRLPSQSRSIRILRHWGPERIESGWWRGPSVRRDYYRLETESGQWLWVFRVLGENRWMLHGWFS